MKMLAMLIAFSISLTITDITDVKQDVDNWTATLTFSEEVPNGKANIFVKVSDDRKVRLRLTPVEAGESTKKLQVHWTTRTGIDETAFKGAIVNLFPR
jgi:hypothetical protein